MSIFDTCVITASDERQAEVFRALIARRIEAGLYPREIRFEVCADPPEGRVGSGGGTLRALRRMRERGSSGRGFSRALVIHAGGESRRLPAYVPEGKLFAPLPSPSSSLVQPVILDHMLALFLRYPWRDEGARRLLGRRGHRLRDRASRPARRSRSAASRPPIPSSADRATGFSPSIRSRGRSGTISRRRRARGSSARRGSRAGTPAPSTSA